MGPIQRFETMNGNKLVIQGRKLSDNEELLKRGNHQKMATVLEGETTQNIYKTNRNWQR